ncbi:MAG: hypothetical protein PVF22_05055 [Candidatus Aminicenantes bacterium]|jgi:hypothetical protein
MKKEIAFRPEERGAVLVVSLLVSVALLIVAAPLLFKLSGEHRTADRTFKSFTAANLAEAGVERAIWEFNFGDITSWTGDSSLRMLTLFSVQASGGSVAGDIEISVRDCEGDNPVIESTGKVPFRNLLTVDETIRVVLEKTALFGAGVFADTQITVNPNVTVKGDVRTNGIQDEAIYVDENSTINGDAICGPGGDPDLAIELHPYASLTGEKTAASEAEELPSVPVPEGLAFRGDYYLDGSVQTISESGEYSSFVLNSAEVWISGDVTLYVSGEFFLDKTELQVEPGSSLTLYLSGSFSVSSNCNVNDSLADPTKLIIYGTDDLNGTVVLRSNNFFYGAVYMPRAHLVLSSNIDFYGAFVGSSIDLNSNVDLSYEGNLEDINPFGESGQYSVKSWQEKKPI